MKTIYHASDTRGNANHGWLNANHSFSFAHFFDPNKLNFGSLRVLNDDKIAPGMGFGKHPHDNMEIISQNTMKDVGQLLTAVIYRAASGKF